MLKHYHAIIFSLPLFMFAANTYSELYKWTDDEGNVHYSQQKPATDFEVIKPPPKPKGLSDNDSASEAGGPIIVDSEEERERIEKERKQIMKEMKDVEEQNQEIAAENEKKKKSNCENSKKVLSQLENTERIKVKGDDGVVRWASVEQKQAQVDKARANVSQWCN